MLRRVVLLFCLAGFLAVVSHEGLADPPPTLSGQQRLKNRAEAERQFWADMERAGAALDALPRSPLVGTVVGPDEKPVADAVVDAVIWERSIGRSRVQHFKAQSQADGSFQFERPAKRYTVHARSADGKLAGIARIDETQSVVTIYLAPAAVLRGRAVDQHGNPAVDAQVQINTLTYQDEQGKSKSSYPFSKSVKSDADGKFEIVGLIPGEKYHLTLVSQAGQRSGRAHRLGDITPKDSQPIELGDRRYSEPPTPEGQTANYFRTRGPLEERLKLAGADARPTQLHLLVVIGPAEGKLSEQLFEFLDTELATLNDFVQVPVGTQDAAALEWLREQYPAALAEALFPTLLALDADGKLLGSKSVGSFVDGDVRGFVARYMPPSLDARQMLADALATAKRDNKRVWLQETGTYCGPCHLLTRYLMRNRETLERQFVFLHIDSVRMEHGDEVTKPYHRTTYQGIPWIVVLDADGQALGDSEGPNGDNFGYPSSPSGVNRFFKLIADTAPSLTAEELAALRTDFNRPAK